MRLHVSNSLVHFSISLLNCFELRDCFLLEYANNGSRQNIGPEDSIRSELQNKQIKNENEEWCIVNFSTRGLNIED